MIFGSIYINSYKVSKQTNIEIVYGLREAFLSYKIFIEKLIKNDSKTNIRNYFDECSKNVEFAFLLDKMIKVNNDENKTNLETIKKAFAFNIVIIMNKK
jgi:hypothetical protein